MKLRMAYILLALAGMMTLPAANFAAPAAPRPPSATASASKNLAEAHAKLLKVQAELEPIRKRIAVNFEVKPEWKAARDALEAAKSDLDSAGKKTQAALEKDPDYKEQVTKRAKAQALVDVSGKRGVASSDDNAVKITDDDVAKAQQDRIDSAIMLKKMEHDAKENDAKYVAARQKLKESQQAWDAMQAQLDEAVKMDPAYPPIKTQLDQAEAAVASAQKQYEDAVKSSSKPRK